MPPCRARAALSNGGSNSWSHLIGFRHGTGAVHKSRLFDVRERRHRRTVLIQRQSETGARRDVEPNILHSQPSSLASRSFFKLACAAMVDRGRHYVCQRSSMVALTSRVAGHRLCTHRQRGCESQISFCSGWAGGPPQHFVCCCLKFVR